MNVKQIVFGSKSERRNFQKISKQWGDKYNVYHNLPFSMIVEILPEEVTRGDFEYYLKTSIDYVICDTDDTPIIAIEFDGMQQGVSVNSQYTAQKGFDERRGFKINKKLELAQKSELLLLVVSDFEFEFLSNTGLTVIDGLIGTAVSHQVFKQEFNDDNFRKYLETRGLTIEEFDQLPSEERDQVFESFGVQVETQSNDHNPIVVRHWEIYFELSKLVSMKAGFGGNGIRLPPEYTGAKAWYEHPTLGHIEKSIVISRYNSSSHWLAIQIARLLAITELATRMGIDIE